MSSDFKVTFSDKMNKYQYDGHANHIPLLSMPKGKGQLWLGDRDSCSMVQLKHRHIKSVVNAQGDMHGLAREGECRDGVMVMPPQSVASLPSSAPAPHATFLYGILTLLHLHPASCRIHPVLQAGPHRQRSELLRNVLSVRACNPSRSCKQQRSHSLS